jgi:hypothetical protein
MSVRKYLRFVEIPSGGITRIWQVENVTHGSYLGCIRWYGGWRQYVFLPIEENTFSAGCLREIADFIECQMQARKSSRARENNIADALEAGQAADPTTSQPINQ